VFSDRHHDPGKTEIFFFMIKFFSYPLNFNPFCGSDRFLTKKRISQSKMLKHRNLDYCGNKIKIKRYIKYIIWGKIHVRSRKNGSKFYLDYDADPETLIFFYFINN
jgi:hypothetical protein